MAEALAIAREHAAYVGRNFRPDALNNVMVAIGHPRLVSYGYTDRPIRLAALAAAWLTTKAAERADINVVGDAHDPHRR